MSWQVYLALILFFYVNPATYELLQHLGCFPEGLIQQPAIGEGQGKEENGNTTYSDISEILSKLDEQALRSVKAVLMAEYARCSKISKEAIIKAFDGSDFTDTSVSKDPGLEKAINRIKRRSADEN